MGRPEKGMTDLPRGGVAACGLVVCHNCTGDSSTRVVRLRINGKAGASRRATLFFARVVPEVAGLACGAVGSRARWSSQVIAGPRRATSKPAASGGVEAVEIRKPVVGSLS
jgi:hypothetical protein